MPESIDWPRMRPPQPRRRRPFVLILVVACRHFLRRSDRVVVLRGRALV